MQLKGEIEQPEEGAELFYSATVVPLKAYRHSFPFLALAHREVVGQLKTTPGLVRWALKTDLPRKQFYTFSVWRDQASMSKFVHTEPHATALRRFAEWRVPGGGQAVEWFGPDAKLSWPEIQERLKEPTFRYK